MPWFLNIFLKQFSIIDNVFFVLEDDSISHTLITAASMRFLHPCINIKPSDRYVPCSREVYGLNQGLANFFYKGSNHQYDLLGGSAASVTLLHQLSSTLAATDNMQMNHCDCPSKTLFMAGLDKQNVVCHRLVSINLLKMWFLDQQH